MEYNMKDLEDKILYQTYTLDCLYNFPVLNASYWISSRDYNLYSTRYRLHRGLCSPVLQTFAHGYVALILQSLWRAQYPHFIPCVCVWSVTVASTESLCEIFILLPSVSNISTYCCDLIMVNPNVNTELPCRWCLYQLVLILLVQTHHDANGSKWSISSDLSSAIANPD